MKKRILYSLQIVALILVVVSLLGGLLQLAGPSNPLSRLDHHDAVYNHIEAFDPSLARLNTLKKLEQYCDSMYSAQVFTGGQVQFEYTYTDIVSSTIRNRFFHGYSYYGFSDNYISAIASKIAMPGLNALVIPDDILKHPYAACSQQSIVMMEVLKAKGFSTRKITFTGKKFGGHFAFEVFYGDAWHFHDPNLEPDKTLLNSYGRPGLDFLVHNPDILLKAYHNHPSEMIMDVFSSYSYGAVNKFPAPRAMIFQKITQFLTYSIWLPFLLALILIRRKYTRASKEAFIRRSRVPVPRIVPELSPVIYQEYRAHGT